MYEFGVATAIPGKHPGKVVITDDELASLKKEGFSKTFEEIMKQVVELRTYEEYSTNGWSRKLAKTVRIDLVPLIVRAVVLGGIWQLIQNRIQGERAVDCGAVRRTYY